MRTNLENLYDIRRELGEIASKEATNLYRLARKAEQHNVSSETVAEIREEANYLFRTVCTYPERLLEWDFEYNTKYAFR